VQRRVEELDDATVGQRLSAIESTLERIEAALESRAGA
jgi:hypothetical protein